VRWFVIGAWLVQLHYRANFAHPAYVAHTLFAVALLALNAYVHHRLWRGREVSWRWALGLSVMDSTMLTAGLYISGGFSNTFFMLYYPVLAMFAAVFTSVRLSMAGVTLVAGAYAVVSLAVEPGVDFGMKEEKVLFMRIVVMYAVVLAVNLVSRFERLRKLEGVERERELQRERIELSQTIHDRIAQSAYMTGLGIETAIELANTGSGKVRDELVARLEATHALSKATMLELRHPIEAGPIFEGRGLVPVLRSHASTFTAITSIPVEVVPTGAEPPSLSQAARGALFGIAHNALTNTFRHARAGRVAIALDFGEKELRMSITDDGVGLPADYAERGHGLRSMRANAERMGGRLDVGPGDGGRGTTVTCAVPYDSDLGGA